MKTIGYIDKPNNIFKKEKFILSALNLAFLSYYFDKKIEFSHNLVVWPDGIFSKFFIASKKIPGSQLINRLKLKNSISELIVVGNLGKISKNFLKKKFKIKIIHIKIPLIDEKSIQNISIRLKKKSICLITLPTPKQELLAQKISKQNNFFKIICIGGGLDIASGFIQECPKFLKFLGLEFIWRLRTDTFRRILRLIKTFINFNFKIIYKSVNLKFKKL